MQSLRRVLEDRLSAAAIALIAGCLMLFQAIAGQAAEIGAATGNGPGVICSAALGPSIEKAGAKAGDERDQGAALCAECCAFCQLSQPLALIAPIMPRTEPIRLVAGRALTLAPRGPPPLPAPHEKNAPTRGPPILS